MTAKNKQYVREAIQFRRRQQHDCIDAPYGPWKQEMVYRQFYYNEAASFLFKFAMRQDRLLRQRGEA